MLIASSSSSLCTLRLLISRSCLGLVWLLKHGWLLCLIEFRYLLCLRLFNWFLTLLLSRSWFILTSWVNVATGRLIWACRHLNKFTACDFSSHLFLVCNLLLRLFIIYKCTVLLLSPVLIEAILGWLCSQEGLDLLDHGVLGELVGMFAAWFTCHSVCHFQLLLGTGAYGAIFRHLSLNFLCTLIEHICSATGVHVSSLIRPSMTVAEWINRCSLKWKDMTLLMILYMLGDLHNDLRIAFLTFQIWKFIINYYL